MTSEATLQKEPATDAEATRPGPRYLPNVDIIETKNELLLVADLPGVAAGEIDIEFEDGQLSVSAPAKPRQSEGTRYLVREYGVGDFHRTFRVSEQIDASRIAAEFNDGVLTLHLPKVEAVKPRKISVQG